MEEYEAEASLDEVKVDPGIDRDVVSALLELRA
jgi:hypothetical protein